ncbi:two-component system chemotaxis response regulator CheV [Xanthomonas sacchari]|nr:two-component system chemotaxis response regulator CheV [Xanthomonas sacchari]
MNAMSHDLLNRIDQRTRLAGHNRLALLLFRLGGRQLFGVNVFKVQEVLRRPELFQVPGLPLQFSGVADVRGRSVPVLDLGLAIGHPEREPNADTAPGYLVVTEFNRSVQGFLVSGVERIVNIAVEDIHPPPELGAESSYLTAVTRFQGELIQVIDVESVLADIAQTRVEANLDPSLALTGPQLQVLVVDDSRVARQQIRSVLDQLGVAATLLSDGRQALDHLLQIHAAGENPAERYAMVISDIEMPAMDGYTLTTEIRRHPGLSGLYVLLHTSLSGGVQQCDGRARGRQCLRRQVQPHRAGRVRADPAAGRGRGRAGGLTQAPRPAARSAWRLMDTADAAGVRWPIS